jgi:Fur family ferric uptake transcriptional regulator
MSEAATSAIRASARPATPPTAGPRAHRRPDWSGLPERLHARGLRWTAQRRTLVDVLSHTGGHVTGAELVERCRAIDPTTVPSTIYRTLDVLEELGLVSHSHGPDGREEYHVLPEREHGHLYCTDCGHVWEIDPAEADRLVNALADARGFRPHLSHLSIEGVCGPCAEAGASESERDEPPGADSARPSL